MTHSTRTSVLSIPIYIFLPTPISFLFFLLFTCSIAFFLITLLYSIRPWPLTKLVFFHSYPRWTNSVASKMKSLQNWTFPLALSPLFHHTSWPVYNSLLTSNVKKRKRKKELIHKYTYPHFLSFFLTHNFILKNRNNITNNKKHTTYFFNKGLRKILKINSPRPRRDARQVNKYVYIYICIYV